MSIYGRHESTRYDDHIMMMSNIDVVIILCMYMPSWHAVIDALRQCQYLFVRTVQCVFFFCTECNHDDTTTQKNRADATR